MIELVKERVEKPDCKINGFILDGCPTSLSQVQQLAENDIVPSVVIALNQNDQLSYDRLDQLRYDPINAKFYNLQSASPQVQARLVQLNEHSQKVLGQRLNEYNNFLPKVESEYERLLIRINNEEVPEKVFTNLCEAIEKTLND